MKKHIQGIWAFHRMRNKWEPTHYCQYCLQADAVTEQQLEEAGGWIECEYCPRPMTPITQTWVMDTSFYYHAWKRENNRIVIEGISV